MMKGWKTWLAAAPLILKGLAGLLAQLGQVHGAGELLAFLSTLDSSPDVAALLAGIGMVGLGHKADRILEALRGGPAAPELTPPATPSSPAAAPPSPATPPAWEQPPAAPAAPPGPPGAP